MARIPYDSWDQKNQQPKKPRNKKILWLLSLVLYSGKIYSLTEYLKGGRCTSRSQKNS